MNTATIPPHVIGIARLKLLTRVTQPAQASLLAFAQRMYPGYQTSPHIEQLCDALEWAVSTPNARLIVTMPPRHSKSLNVSEHLPAWFLGRNPDKRVIGASHSASLAYTFSRRVRNKIADYRYPFPGISVADDKGAVQAWDIQNHQGGYVAVGVGGSPTGQGGDCLTADTRVMSYNGYVPIARLVQTGGMVLGFDHETSKPVWRPIVAARVVRPKALYELVTESGRCIRGTGDHLVFVEGRGYRPLRELRRGDVLVGVRSLRRDVHADTVRDSEDNATGHAASVLLAAVCAGTSQRAGENQVLPDLQCSRAEVAGGVLLTGVSEGSVGAQSSGAHEGLPALRGTLPAKNDPDDVLLTRMCRPCALGTDARGGELALQGRHELREVVRCDATADLGTRQSPLRDVWSGGASADVDVARSTDWPIESGDSPYQPRSEAQRATEPHHTLQDVSRTAPQIERDAVAVVRHLRDCCEPVYDIQVAGCHNFFAEGVLVHNCIIIDDPIRSAADAESETVRDALWEWYQGTLRTRLEPNGAIIVTATRWHEDDLTGRLIEAQKAGGESWRHLHLEAINDQGEPLWPERWPLEALERIRSAVGTRVFEAQYQGRPAPAEGGTFKRDWWRFWATDLTPKDEAEGIVERPNLQTFDKIIQSWDMTFRETKAGSYVVGQVWGAIGADRYLLDQTRVRTDFPGALAEVRSLSIKWPMAAEKLVENKANGPAVVAMLQHEIPGLIEVQPEGGKEARANAVSWQVEAGNVYLPDPQRYPWVTEYLEEMAAFPNAKHDDQVDATSQALVRLMNRGGDFSAITDDATLAALHAMGIT